jgi:undecaprenyl-diphosphatase
MHQYLSNLDYNLFLAMNSLSKDHTLFLLFSFLADKLAYIMGLAAVIMWFWVKPKEVTRKAILLSGVALVLSRGILVEIIRHFYHRPRPFIAHNVTYLFKKIDEASFPSGHASAMFAIAMVIYMYNKKWGTWMFVMAILTGISRVIVGEHYPSDIIGGTILGLIVGYAVVKLLDQKFDGIARKISAISDKLLPFTKSN